VITTEVIDNVEPSCREVISSSILVPYQEGLLLGAPALAQCGAGGAWACFSNLGGVAQVRDHPHSCAAFNGMVCLVVIATLYIVLVLAHPIAPNVSLR
jgi:hypothetical protein